MRAFVLAILVAVASANLAPLFKMENNIAGEYIVVLKVGHEKKDDNSEMKYIFKKTHQNTHRNKQIHQ